MTTPTAIRVPLTCGCVGGAGIPLRLCPEALRLRRAFEALGAGASSQAPEWATYRAHFGDAVDAGVFRALGAMESYAADPANHDAATRFLRTPPSATVPTPAVADLAHARHEASPGTETENTMSESITFTVSERFLHPEGTFPAQLVEWEATTGKFGAQIKWTFETNQEREDGTPARLLWFSSTNFSSDERSKLGQLLRAFGRTVPSTPEEAAAFDPEALLGSKCRVRVSLTPSRDGTDWANIDALFPAAARRAAAPLPVTSGREALIRRYGELKASVKALGGKIAPLQQEMTEEEIEGMLTIAQASLTGLEEAAATTPAVEVDPFENE